MIKNQHFLSVILSLLLFGLLNGADPLPHGENRLNYVGEPEIITPQLGEKVKGYLDVIEYQRVKRPSVGLVLSGGGARGLAHIGVIEVLEEKDIPIDFIVGSSMGSLIGALYAVGYSPRLIREIAENVDWEEILTLREGIDRRDLPMHKKLHHGQGMFTLRFDGIVPVIPQGITPAQRLSRLINELVIQGIYHPDLSGSFNGLRVPYRAVATDLLTGNRHIFDSGDLVKAIRASISIPLIFSPVKLDSLLLVDGGIVANIPVDVAREYGSDLIIAVNTASGMLQSESMYKPWDIADQIVNIMQQKWNAEQLKQADVVITPDIDNYMWSDFEMLEYFIEEGRRAALNSIEEIKRQFNYLSDHSTSTDDTKFYNPGIQVKTGSLPLNAESRISLLNSEEYIDRRDIELLLNGIYDAGEYEAVYAEVYQYPDLAEIYISVSHYPPVQAISITGNLNVSSDTLYSSFSELPGRPLNVHAVRVALEEILSYYRSYGYSIARISDVRFDGTSGLLYVEIDEGVIDLIRVRGNYRTKTHVVRRELPFKRGDIFDVDRAMAGIRNINGTGLFQQTIINVKYVDDNRILEVVVEERYSELIRLGIRVDETYHIQPLFELRTENVFGNWIEAGIAAGGGLSNGLYSADIVTHRIFSTPLSSQAAAYFKFRDYEIFIDDPDLSADRWNRISAGSYREEKWGGMFSVGAQLERLGYIAGMVRVEQQSIYMDDDGHDSDEKHFLVAQRISSRFDTFDRYPYPIDGVGIEVYYETAMSALGSEVSYSKLYLNYESYTTYGRVHTIRPRLVFGFGDETLPLAEQFTMGGKDSFYGLYENDFRGRQVFLTGIEYRYKLPFKILVDTYFSARYDAGAVWRTAQNIKLGDLMQGVGIGLGLDTGIFGPVEISAGRAYLGLGEKPDRYFIPGPWRIYFSVGYPIER